MLSTSKFEDVVLNQPNSLLRHAAQHQFSELTYRCVQLLTFGRPRQLPTLGPQSASLHFQLRTAILCYSDPRRRCLSALLLTANLD